MKETRRHPIPPLRLKRAQIDFASHIRDPQINAPPDGIEERRLDIYRRLFFNTMEGFLAGSFPVTKTLFSPEKWTALVRNFYSDYRCTTPYFREIGQEFLIYLREQRGDLNRHLPFLRELAHYEWVELALHMSEEKISWKNVDRDGDLLCGVPVVSPLVWPLSYEFPVHRINAAAQLTKVLAEPTYLIVFRDSGDRVRFMESNPVTVRLLQLLGNSDSVGLTGEQALAVIVNELRHPNPQVVMEGGKSALEQLQLQDVVLGTVIAGGGGEWALEQRQDKTLRTVI